MVMKKSLLIVILLCSFVLSGCNSQVAEYPLKEVGGESSLMANEPSVNETATNSTNETVAFDDGPEASFKFINISYSRLVLDIILEGFLVDNNTDEPVGGASIELFCDNSSQYNLITDSGGMFSLKFLLSIQGKCKPGDEAWAEFVFEEITYRSEYITLPNIIRTGGGGGGGGGSSGPSLTSLTLTEETCSDGIQNQDETGVDCGGVCDPCQAEETCSDGIQNQDETDVDCGGVCDPCSVEETCSDGIQNQGEEGIDCGGVCDPCQAEETCSDGIQNQGEEGIDCGEVCSNDCEEGYEEVPEFSTLTAILALAGAGIFCLRKRK